MKREIQTLALLVAGTMAAAILAAPTWLVKRTQSGAILHRDRLEKYFSVEANKKEGWTVKFQPTIASYGMGFQLLELPKPAWYRDFALEPKDIVRKVNGIPMGLELLAKAPDSLARQWKEKKPFEVEVLRGGKPLTLHYILE